MDEPALPGIARTLLESAVLRSTPCGDGSMVWHCWGAGPPLVLLHGGAGSWTHWLRNIDAVTAMGRTAWVPDLPGFGDSAIPHGNKDADGVVQPVADGISGLFGDSRVDILAFSFGSLVATLLAAQFPQRVSRLVLVGAPVLPLATGKGVALRAWKHLPTQVLRDAIHRSNLAAMMLHRPESITVEAVALQAVNVPRDRMPRRTLVTTAAFSEALARLQCAYSWIYGEEDALYRGNWPPVIELLRRNPLCGEITFIPGAGHWVQYEEPGRFNAELARHLAGPLAAA